MSARGARDGLGLTLLLCLLPTIALRGQAVTVTGRILHRSAAPAPRPVPRHWALLQEIRGDSIRSIDSARTDAGGRYRLIVERSDTAARYLVVTQFQDVDYFTQPLRVAGATAIRPPPLLVYDTTSAGPAMRLVRRLVALYRPPPGEGRGLRVQELVEVANPGHRTRIAPDTLHPVWTLRLPAGAGEWLVGQGNLAAAAMWLDHDTMKVFAPIWPEAPLRVSYSYTLPGPAVRIPVDQETGELNLLLEDTAAVPVGARFEPLGVHALEGGRFVAYRTGILAGGGEIGVTISGGPLGPEQLLPYVVAATALALALGLWYALRRKAPR